MAFENINFSYNNFCIAALTDTYGSIDTTNATAVLQIRNSSGAVQGNYDLNPSIAQGFSVSSLEYIGPRSTSTHKDGLPFFTLEHNSNSQCTIKRWSMNDTSNRLDLEQTLYFSDTGDYYFNCNSMAAEHYRTSFDFATAVGTGYIRVDNTYIDKIETGDTLYLGLSSNSSYLNAFESVEVTSISGTYVYITASGITPPLNQYNSGDTISFYKDLFLFSDTGVSGVVDKGTLYKIDSSTGNIKETHVSGAYAGVSASAYGIPYNNTIGFIKGSNLMFVDIDDYEVKKSFALNNVKADNQTTNTVDDLDFTSNTVYRLQGETVRRDDSGNIADYDWANYNYQQDGVFPYIDSITMWSSPRGILGNQETTTLYALVRDQYGSVITNQIVYFERESGDPFGVFGEPSKQATTNSEGIASITYETGWYDPNIADSCCDNINFSTYTDGSNVFTGSQYVWGWLNISLLKKFIYSHGEAIRQKIDSMEIDSRLRQLEEFDSTLTVPCLSKFWIPGGHGDSPSSSLNLIRQLRSFSSDLWIAAIDNEFDSSMPVEQLEDKTNSMRLSQTLISRHTPTGNSDDVTVNQFKFLLDARPTFWSEKNSTDTDIWLKLAPFGFDLDQSTLVFKVREVSYAGDTGFIEYQNTANIDVTTFDAGGGLLGLEITCTPLSTFHHNGVVYVYMEVYDNATPANKIQLDYWFKILPDYKAPYITNEVPLRDTIDVPVDTHVEFDLLDNGVGVDLASIEVYVNNRIKSYVATPIADGYHMYCALADQQFHFGQTVEVTVRGKDASDNANMLFDTYRFHCITSTGPWFDPNSFSPESCERGVYRKLGDIEFNVFEVDETGLDKSSIKVSIDNIERVVKISPIIYRIM